jgi:hypothetical protein
VRIAGQEDLSASDPSGKTNAYTPQFAGDRVSADDQLAQGTQNADYSQSAPDSQGRYGSTGYPGNTTDANSMGVSGQQGQQQQQQASIGDRVMGPSTLSNRMIMMFIYKQVALSVWLARPWATRTFNRAASSARQVFTSILETSLLTSPSQTQGSDSL